MSQSTYTVTGMTCSHCADAITQEITTISGVQKGDVEVERTVSPSSATARCRRRTYGRL
ncbi:heavy-metal-associated domain-containing protein [Streptomyces sp. NPDC002758]